MPLKNPVVILADGDFPNHPVPRGLLINAGTLVCCDGAADNLIDFSRRPDVVIGDMDSISEPARNLFSQQLIIDPSQTMGDLEKALMWVQQRGALKPVALLGLTGGGDDRTLGNLLLLYHDLDLAWACFTDSGRFEIVRKVRRFPSRPGQIVALFPQNAEVKITTEGLRYALEDTRLSALHRGTSNSSTGEVFSVAAEGGKVLVYQGY